MNTYCGNKRTWIQTHSLDTHVHTSTHKHTHMHTQLHTYTHIPMHTHKHIHTLTHIHTHRLPQTGHHCAQEHLVYLHYTKCVEQGRVTLIRNPQDWATLLCSCSCLDKHLLNYNQVQSEYSSGTADCKAVSTVTNTTTNMIKVSLKEKVAIHIT